MKAKKALALLFAMSISVNALPITANAQEITQQQTEDTQTEQLEQITTDKQQTSETENAKSRQQIPEIENVESGQQTPEIENTENQQQTPETENIEDKQQTPEPENTEDKQQTPKTENTENNKELELVQKTITIQFDKNDAKGTAPENIIISTGEEIPVESNTMTKENYFFVGWALQKEYTDILFTANEKITVQKLPDDVIENITLYAVWEEVKPCQILYDLGNGELIREHTQTGMLPQNIPYENQNGNQIVQWKNAEGDIVDVTSQIITDNTIYYAVYEQQSSLLETVKHIKYMDGDNGNFYPNKALTRAEACQILYILLKQKQTPQKTFTDVSENDWYANAVCTLATMGLVEGYGENFQPQKEMTRAEFLAILNRIYPYDGTIQTFADVPGEHWAAQAISNAVKKGWIYGESNIYPDNTIKRQEVAAILNKVLNRKADKNTIDSAENGVREFFDVSPTDWAYYDILEASVAHEYQYTEPNEIWTSFQKETLNLPSGLYSKNGTLYYIDEYGNLAKNKTIDGFTFNEYGKYTTNSEILDNKLSEMIQNNTNNTMTQEQKLKVVHEYVRDNYNYLKRPFVQKGQTDWEQQYALDMIDMQKGNCYSFAALYYYLAKQIGYDAHAVIGTIGHEYSPHGWVEIDMDGTTYIFDAEMEMAYQKRGIYYDIFKKTYDNAPFLYIKW
ncbi:S-layer homology domain-containing protein [Lachnospiraceae bacterium 46-61]